MNNWHFKQYDLDKFHIDIVGYIPPKRDPQNKTVPSNDNKPSLWSELSQEQKDYYNRQRAGFRAKSKIRRTIIKYNMRYMWTLTFAKKLTKDGNGNIKDAGNVDDVWLLWKAFLKRCERKGVTFPYIVTIEMSEKRKAKHNEEVYHFHFATNVFLHHSEKTARKFSKAKEKQVGDIDYSINMLDLWGHGVVFATNFKGDTKQAAAAYLTKYVTKSFEDIDQKGVRRYRISKGLPVESYLRTETSEAEMDETIFYIAKEKKCFWRKTYHCIDGGETEILIYTIFPRTAKKQKPKQVEEKRKKRWKSLEKGVPIKTTNSKEEKEKCQYTTVVSQLRLF